MLFDAIFLSLLIAGWTLCSAVPWVVASVRSRGDTGCLMGVFCVFAGNTGAMTVPIVGLDGVGGLWLSFAVALLVPAVLLVIRRFSTGAVGEAPRRQDPG